MSLGFRGATILPCTICPAPKPKTTERSADAGKAEGSEARQGVQNPEAKKKKKVAGSTAPVARKKAKTAAPIVEPRAETTPDGPTPVRTVDQIGRSDKGKKVILLRSSTSPQRASGPEEIGQGPEGGPVTVEIEGRVIRGQIWQHPFPATHADSCAVYLPVLQTVKAAQKKLPHEMGYFMKEMFHAFEPPYIPTVVSNDPTGMLERVMGQLFEASCVVGQVWDHFKVKRGEDDMGEMLMLGDEGGAELRARLLKAQSEEVCHDLTQKYHEEVTMREREKRV